MGIFNEHVNVIYNDGAAGSQTFSAFGEQLVAEMTPQVQLKFPYKESVSDEFVTDLSTNGGTITQGDAMLIASSSTTNNGSGLAESKIPIRYNSGQGGCIRFTAIFTAGVANSRQEAGAGDEENSLCVGYIGADFGIIHRKNSVQHIHLQDEFNVDKLDGTGKSGMTIDKTKLNVFQIEFQYLGAGMITFSIENPVTGRFFEFHRLVYANQNIVPSLYNPTMPLRLLAENTGNTTDITIKSASMAGFVQGIDTHYGVTHSVDALKPILASTETNVLSVRSKASLTGGITNRVRSQLIALSFSNEGTKDVTIRLYGNADVTTPVYSDVNSGGSTLEYDTAGTFVSGAHKILTFAIAKNSSDKVFLQELGLMLSPNDTFTVTADSASSSDVSVGEIFKELF